MSIRVEFKYPVAFCVWALSVLSLTTGLSVKPRGERQPGWMDTRKSRRTSDFDHLLADERLNHRCQIVPGVMAAPSGEILSRFFQAQRRLGKK